MAICYLCILDDVQIGISCVFGAFGVRCWPSLEISFEYDKAIQIHRNSIGMFPFQQYYPSIEITLRKRGISNIFENRETMSFNQSVSVSGN